MNSLSAAIAEYYVTFVQQNDVVKACVAVKGRPPDMFSLNTEVSDFGLYCRWLVWPGATLWYTICTLAYFMV